MDADAAQPRERKIEGETREIPRRDGWADLLGDSVQLPLRQRRDGKTREEKRPVRERVTAETGNEREKETGLCILKKQGANKNRNIYLAVFSNLMKKLTFTSQCFQKF